MINATGLTVRRGTQILLEQTQFTVHPGERVGLIGRNGCGKSTLFAIMRGELDSDAGGIDIPQQWQIAYVEQTMGDVTRSACDYVLDGHMQLRRLQAQRAALEHEGACGEKIAELEMELEQAGAWQAQSKAQALLGGLGFSAAECDAAVGTFSGGWQMRIALARALMAPSDLLLLDEPTNHLDLDAMIWLERWLSTYCGTVMIISHDTEFLEAVCGVILHIEHRKIQRYRGSYSSFLEQRAERLRQSQLAYERQSQESARLERFIERFKAKASKAKQAQSRVKALSRMQILTPLHADAAIDIRIPEPDDTPDMLISVINGAVGYTASDGSPIPVLTDINCRIEAADRIGVLGVNGAGKSTLIKLLAGELDIIGGERRAAKTLKVGYFAQHQMDILDGQASALQHLARIAANSNEQTWRNYLAQFGFQGDRVNEPIEPFSGGEKARLALALIVWHKPNLLILDEPSNHLDVETRTALSAALAQYEGSLLLVSHDRHLLRTTVDAFWLVAHGKVSPFDGDLDDYRQKITSLRINRSTSQDTSPTHQSDLNPTIDRKHQRREQAQARQALAQAKKPFEKVLASIEREMATVQAKVTKIEQQIADQTFYETADRDTRAQVMQEHGRLTQHKEQLELQWLDAMQEIESLEKSQATLLRDDL